MFFEIFFDTIFHLFQNLAIFLLIISFLRLYHISKEGQRSKKGLIIYLLGSEIAFIVALIIPVELEAEFQFSFAAFITFISVFEVGIIAFLFHFVAFVVYLILKIPNSILFSSILFGSSVLFAQGIRYWKSTVEIEFMHKFQIVLWCLGYGLFAALSLLFLPPSIRIHSFSNFSIPIFFVIFSGALVIFYSQQLVQKQRDRIVRLKHGIRSNVAVLNQVNDYVILLNRKLEVQFINTKASKLIDTNIQVMNQRSILSIPENELGSQLRNLLGLIQSNEDISHKFDTYSLQSENTSQWVQWAVFSLKDSDQITCIGKDISNEKMAKTKLKETKDRFEKIVNSVRDLIYFARTHSNQGIISEFISPGFEELTGYDQKIFSEDFTFWQNEVMVPEDMILSQSHLRRIKSGNDSEIEYRIKTRDGDIRWVRDKVKVMRDVSGEYLFFGVISDISKIKQREFELIMARDKAQAAAEVKDRFIINANQELLNPLNSMFGLLNLLKESNPSKEQYEYVELLEESQENLYDIVQELLDYAQLAEETYQMNYSIFELDQFTSDLKSQFQARAKKKNLDFRLDNNSKNMEINTDKIKLNQAIYQLISNAIKYTQEGYVHCTFESKGQDLVIQVQDTDSGINSDTAYLLFEGNSHFHIKPGSMGLGLSLAITKNLIQLLGGQINLESEVGKGSLVTVTIPINAQENKQLVFTKKPVTSLLGKSCLIVMEERRSQSILQRYFDSLQAYVNCVYTLEMAKEKILEQSWNYLIVDMSSPQLNGIELIQYERNIEQEKKRKKTILISVIENLEETTVSSPDDWGYDHILSKPLRIKDLIEVLQDDA